MNVHYMKKQIRASVFAAGFGSMIPTSIDRYYSPIGYQSPPIFAVYKKGIASMQTRLVPHCKMFEMELGPEPSPLSAASPVALSQ